ncbi:MAG: tetratricopeptide repeat protein [Rhodospirillaceae bacterium]|nr:tetratricopeptide repeat protein [Rhodospirillaceae bacterium]
MSLSVNREIRQARLHADKGEVDLAVSIYKAVLERFPRNRRALEGLKVLQGEKPSRTPSNGAPSEDQIKALVALFNQRKFDEVLTQGEALSDEYPTAVEILNILGAVNAGLERRDQAIDCYTRALRIDPEYAEAHNNLGIVFKDLGKFAEAIDSYKKALQVNPGYAEAHNNLGNAFKELGKFDEAISSYADALEIKPGFSESHNNLGNTFKELGRFDEAITCYVKALQIKPDFAEAHNNLSSVKKYTIGDSHLGEMLDQVARPNLSNQDRLRLNFAVGKAYSDIGDHNRAFSNLLEGNRLRKAELNYNIAADRALFSEIKSYFSNDIPRLDAEATLEVGAAPKPIFIVGMPRSGTTLVEQILATHSQVYGAGELEILNREIQKTGWRSSIKSPGLSQEIREGYLTNLLKLGATEPFVTDKMPTNFRWLGFVLSALPDVKIVHVTRDARATCWSNFKHYFISKGNGFGHDLSDVAKYYRLYLDLMDFWREKFPGTIYDLNYDALTQDQEGETRKLLDYVQLDWEEQCLDFHKTKRAVRTVSSTQVRQKIYRGSSEEWRKYEEYLAPMVEGLKGL